ncbi:MAG: GxxExxY protein [Chitinophagaceae bacterium]|nr:GxxExxY protein [Chitinophagaceae bacterium]
MNALIKRKYPETELTDKIAGCAAEVYRILGNGFQEVIYQRAMGKEMCRQRLKFARIYDMSIFYKGASIGIRRINFIVEGKVMVELKAVAQLEEDHLDQVINHLEAYKMKIGLLINFGSRNLQYKRLIKSKSRSIIKSGFDVLDH